MNIVADKEKYKIIENFCSRSLNDKKFYVHSDISFNIIIKLKAIKNLHNLYSQEEKNIIEQSVKNNIEYLDKIETFKNNIVRFDEKDQSKNISSKTLEDIKKFKFDNFEIYFKAELVVNGITLKPEICTDLVFTEEFSIPLNFRFMIKDLTPESFIKISLFSTQLPEESNLIGSSEIRFFDYNTMTLIQGREIKKVFSKEEILKLKTNKISKNDVVDENFIQNIIISKKKEFELNQLVKNYQKFSNQSGANFTIKQDYIGGESDKRLDEKKEQVLFNKNFNNVEQVLLYESFDTYLEIEFMNFELPVVYEEEKCNIYNNYHTGYSYRQGKEIISENKNWVKDIDIRKDSNIFVKRNPIINKFVKLSRISDEAFAKDMRPDHKQANFIEQLLTYPDFINISPEDNYLFWKFRYHYLNRKNCLTKILNAVNWGETKSENEFLNNILGPWTEIDVSDILYMLSFKFCMNPMYANHIFVNMNKVRYFAVNQLSKLSNDEIEFVLLQLVQALRYEDPENPDNSSLKNYLIKRCSKDIKLASAFYWFLNVESDSTGELKETELKITNYYKNIL